MRIYLFIRLFCMKTKRARKRLKINIEAPKSLTINTAHHSYIFACAEHQENVDFWHFFSLVLISYPSCNLFHSNLWFHLRRCCLDEPVRGSKFGLLKFPFHLGHSDCPQTSAKCFPFLPQIAHYAPLQRGCRWYETLLLHPHYPKPILWGFLFPNQENRGGKAGPVIVWWQTVKRIVWWNNRIADTKVLVVDLRNLHYILSWFPLSFPPGKWIWRHIARNN